jgi:hypothetical protein
MAGAGSQGCVALARHKASSGSKNLFAMKVRVRPATTADCIYEPGVSGQKAHLRHVQHGRSCRSTSRT